MIVRFLKAYHLYDAARGAGLAFWEPEDGEELAESLVENALVDFTAAFVGGSSYKTWVSTVVVDGQVVAGAALRESFLSVNTYDLSWVFTDPDHRHKGYAKAAVQFLIDHVRDLLEGEAGTISSSCDEELFPLYQSLGFIAGPNVHNGYSITYVFDEKKEAEAA